MKAAGIVGSKRFLSREKTMSFRTALSSKPSEKTPANAARGKGGYNEG